MTSGEDRARQICRYLPRVLVGVLVGVLAGCFGPAYPEGIPCSERQTCPPGQRCGVNGICSGNPSTIVDAAPGPGDASEPDARPSPACPVCDEDAVCIPESDPPTCVCNAGFTGDGITCVDIDECAPEAPAHDCAPDATCSNTPGSFTCTCNPGFFGTGTQCTRPLSCSDLLVLEPTAATGRHVIDPDGDGPSAEFEVYCDMEREGGGWTLVLVSSDDAQDTWTMAASTRMTTDTTPIGILDALHRDFKSPAYHALPFRDLLFVHAPSGITAEYAGVGDYTRDLGSFVASIPYPVCDLALAGNGHQLTGGTLSLQGQLCDTDLYFNLGDHEGGEATCRDLAADFNNSTVGPVWSAGFNNGCPFDDPALSGLGPQGQCSQCGPEIGTTESFALGFGRPLGLNTGARGTGANHMQMLVR